MAEVEWSKHKTEDGGCWGEVMMNRPERKNAITGLFGERLADAFEALQQDPEVQTILLYGAGGAFCSGLDLKAFNAEPEPDWVAGFQTTWTPLDSQTCSTRSLRRVPETWRVLPLACRSELP